MSKTIFLIIFIAVIAILIVSFIAWFLTLKANGKCPICTLKKLVFPSRITIDVTDEPKYNNNSAKTPPMGWSSWNTFRNHIDQDLIMEIAKAMKGSGLADAGYEYINLDDCWQSSERDSDGKLQGDLRTFSRGIPNLIKDINELDLKVGLYTSNGSLTCEDLPASLGKETLDAKTIASWGCEFFKYDCCHNKAINGNAPAIEAIEINKIGSSEFIELTPDDAEFTGMAKTVKIPELHSGKAIGFLNHAAGTALFHTNVSTGGKYALTIVYHKTLSRKEQYVQVVINETVYEAYFPETKGYSPSGRQQLIVELNAGDNTILLKNPIVTRADSAYLQYRKMGMALKDATYQWAKVTDTQEKPITYSICEWGAASPWDWGKHAGNMWRTTKDILPAWFSIIWIYSRTVKHYRHAGPGGWNDPDMLEVGNGKLTENENKAHFSLWCMMAAPLMLGNDIRKFVDGKNEPVEGNATLKIVTNKQLISIDQDSLGKSAKTIKSSFFLDIIARPLSNGDVAVCILNKAPSDKHIHFAIDSLADDEYLNMTKASDYELHELWSDERTNGKEISATLPKHSVKVYRIKAL